MIVVAWKSFRLTLDRNLMINNGETAFIAVNEGYEGAIWSTGESRHSDRCYRRRLVLGGGREICDSILRDSVYVTVIDPSDPDTCSGIFYLPNVFSPNGDGVNEMLFISFADENVQPIKFQLFNRWGGVIFETEDPYFQWDGMVDGRRAEAGVYVFMLDYGCNGSREDHIGGHYDFEVMSGMKPQNVEPQNRKM